MANFCEIEYEKDKQDAGRKFFMMKSKMVVVTALLMQMVMMWNLGKEVFKK